MDENSNQRGITSRIIVEMSCKIFRRWRGRFVGEDGCAKLCPPLNVVVVFFFIMETSEVVVGGGVVLEGDGVCGWVESSRHGDDI